MNASKKIMAVLVVTLFITSGLIPILVMSTGEGNAAQVNKEIDNYIQSIEYNPDTQIASSGETAEYSVEKKDEGGVLYITTHEVCQAGKEDGSDVLINANKNETKVYPGAILFADKNLANGQPQSVSTVDRSSGELITTLMANGGLTECTVNPQKYGNVQRGLNSIVSEWANKGGTPGSKMSTTIATVYSQEQISVELGINIKVLGGIGISSNFKQTSDQQTCVVKMTQIFYTASFEGGDEDGGYVYPSQYFGPKTTVDSIKQSLKGNPAVIVENVTYGKQVVICATTKNTSTDLANTLNIAMSYGSSELTEKQKETFNQTTFCVTVMGGSDESAFDGWKAGTGQEGINNITTRILNHKLTADDYYNPSIISASMIWLKDSTPACVFNATQYTKTTTQEVRDITVRMNLETGVGYKAYMKLTYNAFDGFDEKGNYVNLHEVTYEDVGAVWHNKVHGISRYHQGSFYITAGEVTVGVDPVLDHVEINPTTSIWLEWTGGGCCNAKYKLWVDGVVVWEKQ